MALKRKEYIVVDRILQQMYCLVEFHIVDFATFNKDVLLFIYLQCWDEDRTFDVFPEVEAFYLSENTSLPYYKV